MLSELLCDVRDAGGLMTDSFFAAIAANTSLAIALSHGAVALLVVVAVLAARDAHRIFQGRLLVLLALSVAALEVSSGPGSASLAPAVSMGLELFGALNVALLWLFCLSILEDDFKLRWPNWIGVFVLSLGTIAVLLGTGAETHPVIAAFSAVAPFAAIVHIAWIAVSERGGDLVEPRRRARLWIPAALVVAALVSVLSEEVQDATASSIVRNGLATLPISVVLLWWLVAVDPTRLRFERAQTSAASQPNIDPRDGALYAALRNLMEEAQVYREPELTIEILAERLSTPTHRLRSLINGGLGFRNFAAFINGYRLNHVKAALGDAQRARDTILSIAFEAGFASLQTFNRVFRDAEDVTPTAFRVNALKHASQNPNTPPIL